MPFELYGYTSLGCTVQGGRIFWLTSRARCGYSLRVVDLRDGKEQSVFNSHKGRHNAIMERQCPALWGDGFVLLVDQSGSLVGLELCTSGLSKRFSIDLLHLKGNDLLPSSPGQV